MEFCKNPTLDMLGSIEIATKSSAQAGTMYGTDKQLLQAFWLSFQIGMTKIIVGLAISKAVFIYTF